MSSQPPSEKPAPRPASRARRDRAVKLTFAAAAILIAAAVWWHQRSGPQWPGWEQDLPAALRRAQSQGRRLLVLFTASPPGHFAREFRTGTLSKKLNKEAVADARLVQVRVSVDAKLDSEPARRYRIRELPTLLLLGADGKELNRREGQSILPETRFRRGFLDCKDVVPPPSAVRQD